MDEETLQFYRGNAEAYARRTFTSRQARLMAFLAQLPPGASILELGCGAGGDTAEMLARGFDVRPTDGAPEMADVASKHLGRTVETLLFHDLDEVEAYDGVWANACLLHVPRDELADVLGLIWRALETGGHLLRQLQGRRWRRPRHAQSLLQLSVAGLAALHLCRGGQMEIAVDRDRRSQRLRRQDGVDAVRRRPQGRLSFAPQTTLKIASASTACARKPTVKASVRNTGRPSV